MLRRDYRLFPSDSPSGWILPSDLQLIFSNFNLIPSADHIETRWLKMTLFDCGFGRIWHDDVTPCVFSNLVAIPNEISLGEFLDRELALIQEVKQRSGSVHAICDMQFLNHTTKDLAALYAGRLKEQFTAGLLHKSFIKPSHKLIRDLLLSTSAPVQPPFSISVHQNLKEALAYTHLNTVKSNYGTVSSLFRFLKHL